ncbi:MAG: hypothetical protein ACI8UO_005685 [Verrucomicrobiales bacterium]|jgi:hypothetical protein
MLSSRRQFLTTAGLTLAGSASTFANPRATSGDSAVEPDWKERLTITVGPDKADLVGTNEKVVQAGIDWVARQGGGTVKVLPGTYKMRNAVHLASNVRIFGSGDDSILVKEPSVRTKLAADSDWFDQEIKLVDDSGFQVGDGVCLQTKNPHNGGSDVYKGTLIARTGNRFKLSKALRKNFWLMGESTAATLFPILNCELVENVVIENIALDGNRENNENLNGNYAGCIFAQDCSRLTFRGVTSRNYNGDGMSWQICHDVLVEDCRSHDNTGLGLHPGSGSQRPIIRGNELERNKIGIFFCWGVRNGLAEGNRCLENSSYGVSIGHRDTDNRIVDNDIIRSGKAGVLFRPERGKDFAPHRNIVENNRITDSGEANGIGVDVQGEVESITLKENEIRETREPAERVGVRIGPKTRDVELIGNQISGFATEVDRPSE